MLVITTQPWNLAFMAEHPARVPNAINRHPYKMGVLNTVPRHIPVHAGVLARSYSMCRIGKL